MRQVVAVNLITGDYIITPSVSEMGRRFFGATSTRSSVCISDLCRRRRNYNNGYGYSFRYVNNDSVHHRRPQWGCKPVFQIGMNNDEIIGYFGSISMAARYVFNNVVGHNCIDAGIVRRCISMCARGKLRSHAGFKWRYVEHDEPAENVPLPESDDEGL